MACTFTKNWERNLLLLKAGGPDPDANPRLRVLMLGIPKRRICRKKM